MAVILRMEPKSTRMSWEEFCAKTKGSSIAIDGFINGPPNFDPKGPWANFDHHRGVDRLATRATCGQVYVAIKQGLLSCFCNETGPQITVYANHPDEDVSLSFFLLKWGYFSDVINSTLLKKLVMVADLLDTTFGTFPSMPADILFLEQFGWVFEPYHQFRLSGRIDNNNMSEFSKVVTNIEGRIM